MKEKQPSFLMLQVKKTDLLLAQFLTIYDDVLLAHLYHN
jgi:hypothetical protein